MKIPICEFKNFHPPPFFFALPLQLLELLLELRSIQSIRVFRLWLVTAAGVTVTAKSEVINPRAWLRVVGKRTL